MGSGGRQSGQFRAPAFLLPPPPYPHRTLDSSPYTEQRQLFVNQLGWGIIKEVFFQKEMLNFSVTYSRGWFIHYLFSLFFRAAVREQRITKSKRGTVAGKEEHLSFLPLPHPSLTFLFWLSSHFCAGKTPKSFFAPQIHGSACYAGYHLKGL